MVRRENELVQRAATQGAAGWSNVGVTNYRRRSAQRKRQVMLVTAWVMVIAIALTGLGAVIATQLH